MWWTEERKKLSLLELTVPFKTVFSAAQRRKGINYEELISDAKNKGYETTLITIEVGSRGVPNVSGFKKLQKELALTSVQTECLLMHKLYKGIDRSIWTIQNKLN